MTRALTLAAVAVLGACSLHAQTRVSFGVSGAQEISRSRVGATRARLSGQVFSGEVTAMRRRFIARLRYGQGRVTNDSAARDVVEGQAFVGYRVRPWLDVGLGPQARTFVVPGLSDRRWLFWSGRVTARGSPFPGRIDSFVELWYGFTGRLNRPAASARGGGIEGGIELRLPQRPWWARLGYRIEQGRVAGDTRETVEAFTLTVGYDPVR